MARKIKAIDIGKYCTDQYEQLLREVVLETDRRVKLASPVLTGRFSASWQVGENSASGGIKPSGNYNVPATIERLGYSQERLGRVYSIHNNLPYAERLANGWSKRQQPTPGWVQGIAKDVQTFARSAAARIGRES